jgi:voltage-gated potassium channel
MKMRPVMGHARGRRFLKDVFVHTPIVRMVLLLFVLWHLSSTLLFLVERDLPGATINSYGAALYWSVAAFSTAGIADAPLSGAGRLIGGLWIVLGSVIFFGAIVATVTAYFMRPMLRPHKKIIETIEYNLEQLNELSLEELELLKGTVDTLITHVEHLKQRHAVGPGL